MPLIPIPFLKSHYNRSHVAIGVFACIATVAINTNMPLSAEIEKSAYTIDQSNLNTSNEKNQSAEIESLRKQVQATARKFKEYQAQLFRSSHPKDQNKIAELGQLLSEKEKLNNQLSNSLKGLEKELAATNKQIANLEVSSNALNSLLNANRTTHENEINSLKRNLDQLTVTYEADKQTLLNNMESHKTENQNYLSKIESHENDKKNLIAKIDLYANENQTLEAKIESNEKEKQNLLVTMELYESEKLNLLAKIESYEAEKKNLITKIEVFENEHNNILNQIEEKYASIDALKNDELQSAHAAIQINETRIRELENNYNNSEIFTVELSSQLAVAHQKQALIQYDLTAALNELEHSKSLNLESQNSASELASLKTRLEQQKLASEEDYEETLAIIHSYYQSSLEEVAAQLADVHEKFNREGEKGLLLQEQLEQALAGRKNHENYSEEQLQQIETLSKELASTKFKYVFREQYIEQLNQAVAHLRSQQQSDVDKLQIALEERNLELNGLQKEMQALNEDKLALEALKASHEAELTLHNHQAQVEKASAELSFVVRETELTAYQLMLQIEIERLNAEIAENAQINLKKTPDLEVQEGSDAF
ncbi:MAG: hypothetical protein H0X29_08205 [Parachlamydiaceae bacterium]|nr:hypothetical protein [Parachlamydiaceae bacterium]